MQSFNNENLLDHQPARLVSSPPRTPSPQLQNPPQTGPCPRQSLPQIAPHPNPPPPLLDDKVFEPLGDPGVPPPGSDQAQADRPNLLPITFQETPAVQMAYLSTVMANVYGHLTVQQATNQLNNTLDGLLVAGILPEYPRPVQTLISAQHRLGLDPDQHIIQYYICPTCWKHYTPRQMEDMDSPNCHAVPNCDGVLYTNRWDARHKRIQTPTKIHPQSSIIGNLWWLFMHPGFAKMIQDNRDHQAGKNDDEDFVMTDMSDGDTWNEQYVGDVREVGNHGTIRDMAAANGPAITNLNAQWYGLHLSVNRDW